MHGPASVGATMSASEVTVQFGTVSAICSAIPGSKIVTSSGTSSSRWRTSSAIRSGNASSRVATQTMSGRPDSSASRTDSSSASESHFTSPPPASSASQTSPARSPPPTRSTRRRSDTARTLLRRPHAMTRTGWRTTAQNR